MTTLRDPLVAEALDRLFPSVDSDPEETLARARTTAERIRQSRTARARRAGLLAFALLTLLAGAAFAATRFDVLPWFDQSNRSSASFSRLAMRNCDFRSSATLSWYCFSIILRGTLPVRAVSTGAPMAPCHS